MEENAQSAHAMPLVSVIIVTYNSKKYMERCIRSICSQSYPHEIIILDNRSTDGTPDFVRDNYPHIELIENGENVGYGTGNNIAVQHARGEFLIIINPDTIMEPDCMVELVTPLISSSRMITAPKALVYDGSSINTCGNINHFSGLTFTRGLGSAVSNYAYSGRVDGISGSCFAIKKEYYLELGGFDENFFLYNEDSDFSWNANMSGYQILYVPTALLRHDYHLKVNPNKIYQLEKGRYMVLRKYYKPVDFVLIAPALLMSEILIWGYALRLGGAGIRSKLMAMQDGFSTPVTHRPGDHRSLIMNLNDRIPINQLSRNSVDIIVKSVANILFRINYQVLSRRYRKAAIYPEAEP